MIQYYGREQKQLTFRICKYNRNYNHNEDFTRKLQFVITKVCTYYACSLLATVQLIYNFKHAWLYTPGNCMELRYMYFFIQEAIIACVVLETPKGTFRVYTCTRDS